ncbi:MAG: MAC/perforin domain-containing protein, partial [Phocaeicola sp.]
MKNFILYSTVFLLLFSSCSKEILDIEGDSIKNDAQKNETIGAYDYTSHTDIVEIAANPGELWTISTNSPFFYLPEESGKGAKSVKIIFGYNPEDKSRTDSLTVFFPESNRTEIYHITQRKKDVLQARGDNTYESVGDLFTGDKSHIVGMGYNLLGSRLFNKNAIKDQGIFDFTDESKIITSTESGIEAKEEIFNEVTISEMSNRLATSIGGKGKYQGFSAEVRNKFNMTSSEEASNEYIYIKSYLKSAERYFQNIDMSDAAEAKNWMNELAWRQINGLRKTGDGYEKNSNYNQDSDFEVLIKLCGTHLITKSYMGGFIENTTSIKSKKEEKSYNLESFAKIAYQYSVGDSIGATVDASVEDQYRKSFMKRTTDIKSHVSIVGGKNQSAIALAEAINKAFRSSSDVGAKRNMEEVSSKRKEWINDMNEMGNLGAMSLDIDNLIPLWKLMIDPERASKFKSYYERKALELDDYVDQSVCSLIKLPTFTATGT